MNTRIQELAIQVMNSDPDPRLTAELYCFTKSEFEKFAELIVKEFIDIVPWQYEAKIKQHFGVQE